VRVLRDQNVRLFAAICLFGIAFLPRYIVQLDPESMYQVARSMAEGHLSVPCRYGVPGVNGACYSTYYPLTSVLAIPFVIAGKLVTGVVALAPDRAERFLTLLLPTLATAGTAVIIRCLAKQNGASDRTATVIGLAYAFGTEAFLYWHTLFAESIAAFFVAASALWLPRRGAAHILGAATLGAVVLTKPQLIFLAVPLAIAATWKDWRHLLAPCVSLAISVALLAAYNIARFNSITDFGGYNRSLHGNATGPLALLRSAALLTFSPGRGILLYSGIAVIGLVLLVVHRHQAPKISRMASFAFAGATVIALLNPGIGYNWGTRYLLPVMPLMCVGLIFAGTVARRLAIAAGAFSFIAAAPTLVVNFGLAFEHATSLGHNARADYWSVKHGSIVWLWSHLPDQPWSSLLPWWVVSGRTTYQIAAIAVAIVLCAVAAWLAWLASSPAQRKLSSA
jgi:hypothetical protein